MHRHASPGSDHPNPRSAADRSSDRSDRRTRTAASRTGGAVAQRIAVANRTGLPDGLKANVERLSGVSLDHVRVHRNSAKPAQLQAHAYAQGGDIHLAPGQDKHLPHETWHVAQQAQGRVRPTLQRKAVSINDDPALEREADRMGAVAAQRMPVAPAAPVPGRAVAAAAATPVIQGRWVRIAGGEPEWRDDTTYPANWFEANLQAVTRRVSAPRTRRGYRNVTTNRPETHFSLWPSAFGSQPVYKPVAAIAPRLAQLDAWVTAWGEAKAQAVFGAFDMRNAGDYGRVTAHAGDIGTMTLAQLQRIVAYPKPKATAFLQLPGGALAPRCVQMDAWAAQWGQAKADAVFGTYNLGLPADYNLIHKHAAEITQLPAAVVTGMMQRPKAHIDTFLNTLNAGEVSRYFAGTLARNQALVGTDAEFGALARLVHRERAFDQPAVLHLNPTAAQGSHYLREHGAHNTGYQTVVLAVEYALRGGGGATKGNWVSNDVSERALNWAKLQATQEIQASLLQNAAAGSLLHLPTTLAAPPGHAPIFGTPGTPTANIYARVQQVLAPPADYENATVSGTTGNAQVTIQGDFQPEVGGLVNGAYAGVFTGRLTGAALGNGANAANQALFILDVSGSGNATVTIAGTTAQIGGQNRINGFMSAPVLANNAQVSFKTGVNPNVRYFNGRGNYHGMVSANINAANSSWVRSWNTVDGEVHGQALTDGCHNSVNLPRTAMHGPNLGNWGVGSAINGNGTAYTPGTTHEINVAGASKARNLQADVTNHTGGAAGFQANSLHAIVTHATLAGRPSSYKRAANNTAVTGQLLAPSIMITGTRPDLVGAGMNPAIMDLSNLHLQVANVAPGYSRWNYTFDARTVPVAGRNYNIQLHNQWYTFRLVTYNPAPAAVSFRVLLYLKSQNAAEYEPFTGYPV